MERPKDGGVGGGGGKAGVDVVEAAHVVLTKSRFLRYIADVVSQLCSPFTCNRRNYKEVSLNLVQHGVFSCKGLGYL